MFRKKWFWLVAGLVFLLGSCSVGATVIGRTKTPKIIESAKIGEVGGNPTNTALLFVQRSGIYGYRLMMSEGEGTRMVTKASGDLSWPSGWLAVIGELNGPHEVVDRETGEEVDRVIETTSSWPAVGPDGVYAYIQEGQARSTLVVRPEGAAKEAYRIIAPNFSGRGDLAFAAKGSADSPWGIYIWRPSFGGKYAKDAKDLITVPMVAKDANGREIQLLDAVFPTFSPEGDALVFAGRTARMREGDPDRWELYLWRYSAIGFKPPAPEQLTTVGKAIDPDWGPGDLIAYTYVLDETVPEDFLPKESEIHLIDLKSESRRTWKVADGMMPSWWLLWRQQRGTIPTPMPPEPRCEAGLPVPEGACMWLRWQGRFQQSVQGASRLGSETALTGFFDGTKTATGEELEGLCETDLSTAFGAIYWDPTDTGGRECGTGEVWEPK